MGLSPVRVSVVVWISLDFGFSAPKGLNGIVTWEEERLALLAESVSVPRRA